MPPPTINPAGATTVLSPAPPNLFPLDLALSPPMEFEIYCSLWDTTLPFAAYNPLDPAPIAFIDSRIRRALATRQESLPPTRRQYILMQMPPDEAAAWLLQHPAPLATFFYTEHDTATVSAWLQSCRQMQKCSWQHGVFMEVAGSGVLITGHSGIGKSELALELLSRGHRLIADDAPYFIQGRQGIEGYCPENIRDLLEVRGLGIINVRDLFGANALKYRKNLRLVIELYTADHKNLSAESRLHGERGQSIICAQAIPLFRLPIAPGRNIAVFVETVVR
ncbi:MAG: hypothetical protein ACP5Q0_07470, partial [Halothiobacillus sp.]